MTDVIGGNLNDMHQLAADFRAAAEQFDGARNNVLRAVARTAWQGHTAEQFRAEWNAVHTVVMGNLAGDLREAASDVVRNLEDQTRTSSSRGGPSGNGPAWLAGGIGAGALSGMSPHDQRMAMIKMGWKDGDAAWDAMSKDEQRAFIDANLKNGELDILPPHVRYAINRQLLLDEYLRLNSLPHPTASETARIGLYSGILHDHRQVLLFDPSGDGRIAVVSGDISNAANFAVQVPGISNSMDNFGNLIHDGDNLYNQLSTGDVAVVSWLGYDAPVGVSADLVNLGLQAGTDVMAHPGASSLNAFVTSMDAQRPDAHITVIGHSYGSLVTGLAARDGMPADDVVLIGSPGAGVQSAAEFVHGGVGPTVHVGVAGDDPVVFGSDLSSPGESSHFGTDPAMSSFGPDVDHRYFDGGGHSGYYTEGSDQLKWIGNIVDPDAANWVGGRGPALGTY